MKDKAFVLGPQNIHFRGAADGAGRMEKRCVPVRVPVLSRYCLVCVSPQVSRVCLPPGVFEQVLNRYSVLNIEQVGKFQSMVV